MCMRQQFYCCDVQKAALFLYVCVQVRAGPVFCNRNEIDHGQNQMLLMRSNSLINSITTTAPA